jgi:hypothetical protein
MIYKKDWNNWYIGLQDINWTEPTDPLYKRICFRNLKWSKIKLNKYSNFKYTSEQFDFKFKNGFSNANYIALYRNGDFVSRIPFAGGSVNVPKNSSIRTYLSGLEVDK